MSTKLEKDLKKLVNEKVISPDTAHAIRSWYDKNKGVMPNRLLLVSGVLGALLTGLGIILILAHNWDHFSRPVRTILAFSPLLLGQGIVAYVLINNKNYVWKESAATFLFFAVGSCISLISQIYHIPGEVEDLLLIWMILCAPLIYLLTSKALGILHLVFLTWWAVSSGYSYQAESPWVYWVLLAILVPFIVRMYHKNTTSNTFFVITWLLSISMTICLGAFVETEEMGFLLYILFFSCLYSFGAILAPEIESITKNGFLVTGSLGTVITLLIMSFQSFWEGVASLQGYAGSEWLLLSLFFVLLVFLSLSHLLKRKGFDGFLVVPFAFSAIFWLGTGYPLLAMICLNLFILVLGISILAVGARTKSLLRLNYGLLIVAILIVCRFFDTHISFVIRGLVFIGVGIAFFIANYSVLRDQRKHNHKL
ncbi:DUF2157 domain-containing protein [Ascidiimonas aurantiaca]|uniref:DUF2157 domain-containing protein n=1 Tax=Ascidiimonas aurantiaca TaxID=1685432 RepID=UPI0030EBA100